MFKTRTDTNQISLRVVYKVIRIHNPESQLVTSNEICFYTYFLTVMQETVVSALKYLIRALISDLDADKVLSWFYLNL